MSMKSLIQGLSLLRYPEVVQDLGERRFHLDRIAAIRKKFPKVKIHQDAMLIGYKEERLSVGNHSTISAGTVLAFGDHHNGFGQIKIGESTWLGQYNNLRAGGGDILIGDHCLVSQFCTLVASNHSMGRDIRIKEQRPDERKRGVSLGNDVWLGAGVTVLPGVAIGDGVVVGAGSVVSRDIPSYQIWAGVPARKIGQRDT